MYLDHNRFNALYPDADLSCGEFEKIEFEVERLIDRYTTGADGVAKLRIAFPADLPGKKAVELCAAKLVYMMHQIDIAERTATHFDGENRRNVSHIASGNESITFFESSKLSAIAAAAADGNARVNLLADTVRAYLSGIDDANGVNLLYMGPYPRRYLNAD